MFSKVAATSIPFIAHFICNRDSDALRIPELRAIAAARNITLRIPYIDDLVSKSSASESALDVSSAFGDIGDNNTHNNNVEVPRQMSVIDDEEMRALACRFLTGRSPFLLIILPSFAAARQVAANAALLRSLKLILAYGTTLAAAAANLKKMYSGAVQSKYQFTQ